MTDNGPLLIIIHHGVCLLKATTQNFIGKGPAIYFNHTVVDIFFINQIL